MPWSMSSYTSEKENLLEIKNEKRKKLLGFSFYINIGNFEAFLWNLNLSTNHLFWRCDLLWQCFSICLGSREIDL